MNTRQQLAQQAEALEARATDIGRLRKLLRELRDAVRHMREQQRRVARTGFGVSDAAKAERAVDHMLDKIEIRPSGQELPF